jgi:hypothetical protein
MWPTIAVSIIATLISSAVVTIAAVVVWCLMLAFAIPYWPIVAELKRRMRDGSITASGSKYSFANPLTYRWELPREKSLN